MPAVSTSYRGHRRKRIKSRQKLDQEVQDSVRKTIAPAAVRLHTVNLLGHDLVVTIAPPWSRKAVHHLQDRVLIRKGTNVLDAKPEESRKLREGEYLV